MSNVLITEEIIRHLKVKLDGALLRERLMKDTLDAICEIVEYKPNHKEFSGDRLVEIIQELKSHVDGECEDCLHNAEKTTGIWKDGLYVNKQTTIHFYNVEVILRSDGTYFLLDVSGG